MEFKELESMCERATSHVFSKTKLLITVGALIICGLLVVFSALFSFLPTMWGTMSPFLLLLVAVFACLTALGVVLICSYHDEIKKKPLNYMHLFRYAWNHLVTSATLLLPVIAAIVALWLFEIVFLLVSKVPVIGDVLEVLLAFVPFLWILAFMILCVGSLFFLFSFTPILALRSLSKQELIQAMKRRASFKAICFLALCFL